MVESSNKEIKEILLTNIKLLRDNDKKVMNYLNDIERTPLEYLISKLSLIKGFKSLDEVFLDELEKYTNELHVDDSITITGPNPSPIDGDIMLLGDNKIRLCKDNKE